MTKVIKAAWEESACERKDVESLVDSIWVFGFCWTHGRRKKSQCNLLLSPYLLPGTGQKETKDAKKPEEVPRIS